MYLQVDSALEEVEQMDLDKYLALVEQYKGRLGPSHYQLVIMRRYCTLMKYNQAVIFIQL